jgi:drug/metabolite transporter (DMT)-like permease
VAAAGGGVLLLLWSELSAFGGQPDAVLAIVAAAAVWAYGTHRLRRSPIDVPLLAIVFWMTAITALAMALAAVLFERGQWRSPEPLVWGSIAYNAVGVFGFAHAAWFYLARTMPPVASSISVMLIPVLGVFSGAVLLGETVHGTDWAAVALIVLAIALVLLKR